MVIMLREPFILVWTPVRNSRISVQASGDMYALYTRTCNLDYLDMPEPQWSAFQKSRTLSWTDPDIGGASSLFATCLFFSLLIASFLVLGQTRGREKCLWPDESSRVSHCITHLIDERPRKSNPWYAKGRSEILLLSLLGTRHYIELLVYILIAREFNHTFEINL